MRPTDNRINEEICLVYFRRSQDREDRQQLSLEKQEVQVKQVIERNSFKPVYLPPEERSAKRPGRPIFNDMMERIERGEASHIAVWALSRLSRNPIDGGKVIYALDSGKLTAIHTPTRTYRNTPDDKMVLAIELALAKKNNDDLSVQVKEGFQAKRAHGQYPGPAPIGYLNTIVRPGERNIVPDPDKANMVRDCFEFAGEGFYTLNDVWVHAWEIGLYSRVGKRLGRQTVAEMLQRRVYMGLFKYGGDEWHQGSYEPLVTPELFTKVQIAMGWQQPVEELLVDKRPSATSGRYYPYKDLLLCQTCKFSVTAYTKAKILKKTNERVEYGFYTCTKKSQTIDCREQQVSTGTLLKQIKLRMGEYEITEADALECKGWVYGLYKQHLDNGDRYKDVWYEYRQKAEQALDVLDIKLEAGTISDERYKLRAAVHEKTIETMTQKLSGTNREAELWLELSNETFNSVVNLAEVFEIANDDERRKLMKMLGSNWYLGNKKVALIPRKPLDAFHVDNREKHGNLVWRARPDSNRRSPP